ncbi:hypothetical protein Tco_1021377 [Tanacetum coccineum]
MARLWWLWWPQPARPPPQRWRHAGEHSEAPPRVAPPQPDTTWGRVSWLSEVVRWGRRNGEDGDVDVGCDVACRDDGGLVVKILAGEDGGSPENPPAKFFGGDGWPEIGERGERILCELLEYMDVHDNDATESSQPSWGKMCTSGT